MSDLLRRSVRQSRRLIAMQQQATVGKLAVLPGEIRTQIYVALFKSTPVDISEPPLPPIALACKTLYRECIQTFWRYSSWEVHANDKSLAAWPAFRDKMFSAEWRKMLKGPVRVIFNIGCLQQPWTIDNQLWGLQDLELTFKGDKLAEVRYLSAYFAMSRMLCAVRRLSVDKTTLQTVQTEEYNGLNGHEAHEQCRQWAMVWNQMHRHDGIAIIFAAPLPDGSVNRHVCINMIPDATWPEEDKFDRSLQHHDFCYGHSVDDDGYDSSHLANPFAQAHKKRLESQTRVLKRRRDESSTPPPRPPPVIPGLFATGCTTPVGPGSSASSSLPSLPSTPGLDDDDDEDS